MVKRGLTVPYLAKEQWYLPGKMYCDTYILIDKTCSCGFIIKWLDKILAPKVLSEDWWPMITWFDWTPWLRWSIYLNWMFEYCCFIYLQWSVFFSRHLSTFDMSGQGHQFSRINLVFPEKVIINKNSKPFLCLQTLFRFLWHVTLSQSSGSLSSSPSWEAVWVFGLGSGWFSWQKSSSTTLAKLRTKWWIETKGNLSSHVLFGQLKDSAK